MRKIKSIRVYKDIRQKDFAQMLGITPQYLARIESGKLDPKMSMVLKIADILGVSILELIDRSDKQNG